MLFPQDSKEKSRCQNYREDEEPVDAAEIRKILLNSNNIEAQVTSSGFWRSWNEGSRVNSN